MKKSFVKFVALALVLIMVLGAVPVSAASKTIENAGSLLNDMFGWLFMPIPQGSAFPEQEFLPPEVDGVTVTVRAPEGALPAGTDIEVAPVDMAAVQNAVDASSEVSGTVLAAVDITFRYRGEEIQPTAPVTVTMTSAALDGQDNLTVVHIDDQRASHAESVFAEFEEDTATFDADKFSVYAVIDGNTDEEARATVIFHRTDGSTQTFYVKNRDTFDGANGSQDIHDIVVDPGCGPVESTKLYVGWVEGTEDGATYDENTERKTIEQVRRDLTNMTITEGMTIHYYPIILNVWKINYIGDKPGISLGMEVVLVGDNTEKAPYTVNMPFATDTDHHFEGWLVADGKSNIVPETATYGGEVVDLDGLIQNGTDLEIKGNITLSVSAPKGHWLVFNNNAKGATYCAPRFIKEGETTVRPRPDSEMKRVGYTFGGWYTDEACSDGNEFTFGHTIDETTTLHAKWIPNSTADYIILIWQENVDADGYDFIKSVKVENAYVGSAVNVSISGDVARIDGTNYSYTGFTTKEITYLGSGDDKTKVAIDGTTVVNVYFDRKEYTLNFQIPTDSYSRATNPDWDRNTYYVNVCGGYYRVYDHNDTYYYAGTIPYATSVRYRSSQTFCTVIDGYYRVLEWSTIYNTWYTTVNSTKYWYDEGDFTDIYCRVSSSSDLYLPVYTTIKSITAKYQQVIADNFPIVGDNGVTYNNGERWMPQANDLNPEWTEVMVFIDTMPYDSIDFHLNVATRPLKTMYYLVEALPTDTDTVTYDGKQYVLYTNPITARYNGVSKEDFAELSGFEKYLAVDNDGNEFEPDSFLSDHDGFYMWNTADDQNMYFLYTRKTANILYNDGVYRDGDGTVITEGVTIRTALKEVDSIPFGSDLSSYNKGGDDYFDPSKNEATKVDGFVFGGWYLDEACTSDPYTFDTLPQGGLTLYAKWVQIQYRIFLHPNAGHGDEHDTSLSWGDETLPDDKKQQTCFRVSYGDKISSPDGTRGADKEILLNGWYTDEALTNLFNPQYTALTDDIVKTEYDRENTWTDTYDKWGDLNPTNKKDSTAESNRFWISRRLDLYADWRATLKGAEGIGITYDLNGGSGNVTDSILYQDNTNAIAQGAPTGAPSNDLQFLYWEIYTVQNYEDLNSPYVRPSDELVEKVYPGGDFKVYKKDAQKTPNGTDDDGNPLFKYTIKLVAVYGPKAVPDDTHITWHSAIIDVNGDPVSDDPFNDIHVNITNPNLLHASGDEEQNPKYDTDKGWMFKDKGVQINQGIDIPDYDLFTIEGYKFLGWARVGENEGYHPDTQIQNPESNDIQDIELFLKWIDTEGVEPHYEAKNSAGTYVPVTQVAADEVQPYHDLYAVWVGQFKIYHSGVADGNVETYDVPLKRGGEVPTFNLLNPEGAKDGGYNITENYLYGGYYLKNGFNAETTKDGTLPVYDGTNWTWTDPQLVSAMAMNPVAGETYYIKEVPAEKYLQSYIHYTYYGFMVDGELEGPGVIGSLFAISDIDDLMYCETGFVVKSTDSKLPKVKVHIVKSVTIQPQNHPENEATLTTEKVFHVNGDRNYLTYSILYNEIEISGETNVVDYGDDFTVSRYWKTPDNLYVTGIVKTSYSDTDNVTTLTATDTPVSSVISETLNTAGN